MARVVEDAPITTRAARDRLAQRHKPYWRAIEGGVGIGYRKGARGGVWLARIFDPAAGEYVQHALGRADDVATADGATVLDYRQALAAAQAWTGRQRRVAAGLEAEPEPKDAKPYTVADAISAYLADYEARGGKSLKETRAAVNAHILPALGATPMHRLTRDAVKRWHRALAASAPRRRTRTEPDAPAAPAASDPEAVRRRKSTANRVLSVLKAALNHARAEGAFAGSDDAWAAVKPFREADAPKVRYLLDDEAARLVNACPADLRALVTGALLTGCRYGELAAMTVGDFDAQAGAVRIGRSKSGKPRHVVLTDEGRQFFAQQTGGRPKASRAFERAIVVRQATRDREAEVRRGPWGKSDQFRPLREACAAAGITPAVSFHVLRHSYASRLVRNGAPIAVVAAQLGHADTRITERHYAHLAPGYVADTVRATFSSMGIVAPSNVRPLVATR